MTVAVVCYVSSSGRSISSSYRSRGICSFGRSICGSCLVVVLLRRCLVVVILVFFLLIFFGNAFPICALFSTSFLTTKGRLVELPCLMQNVCTQALTRNILHFAFASSSVTIAILHLWKSFSNLYSLLYVFSDCKRETRGPVLFNAKCLRASTDKKHACTVHLHLSCLTGALN